MLPEVIPDEPLLLWNMPETDKTTECMEIVYSAFLLLQNFFRFSFSSHDQMFDRRIRRSKLLPINLEIPELKTL